MATSGVGATLNVNSSDTDISLTSDFKVCQNAILRNGRFPPESDSRNGWPVQADHLKTDTKRGEMGYDGQGHIRRRSQWRAPSARVTGGGSM